MADYSSYDCQRQRRTRSRGLTADEEAGSGDARQQKSPPLSWRKRASHVRSLLAEMSREEDLRVRLPDGKMHRAYYTNLDRTHARSEYRVDGRRAYVYGRIRGERLVRDADPADSE